MITVFEGEVAMKGIAPEIILETCCVLSAVADKMTNDVGKDNMLSILADMGRFAVAEHDSDEQGKIGADILKNYAKLSLSAESFNKLADELAKLD